MLGTSRSSWVLSGVVQLPRVYELREGGREARTGYRLLEALNEAAHIEAELHTGRTHQIRVHFQHLGCPLAGDSVYGGRPARRLRESTGYLPPRQMLHATSLGFVHPYTSCEVRVEAPLPEDFLPYFPLLLPFPFPFPP